MNEKLKPCPFCGGEAEYIIGVYTELHLVTCKCGACRTGRTEEEAIMSWNKRAYDVDKYQIGEQRGRIIEVEIPKEFEEHFKHDQFEESLTRLNADAHMTAGNYEKETAIMLIKALKNSKPAYDVDKVVEQLESECSSPNDYPGYVIDIERAIEIVKAGRIDGN